MIIVENVFEQPVGITFQHIKTGKNAGTSCSMYILKEPRQKLAELTPDATGTAKLSKYDQFDRVKGRKVAFGRAVKALVPRNGPKDVDAIEKRAALWTALFYETNANYFPPSFLDELFAGLT